MVKDNKITLLAAGFIIVVLTIFFINRGFQIEKLDRELKDTQQVNSNTSEAQGPEDISQMANKQSAEVQIQSSSMEMDLDQTGEATILLAEGEQAPTAFYLHITYDPDLITITDIGVGDIWEDANVLEEVVNEDTGEIELSVGQGFGAEKTGSNEMVRIQFETADQVDANVITMNVEEDSTFYYSGMEEGVKVNPQTLEIQINN